MKHRSQIGFGSRFAIRIRPIDARHHPRTLFDYFREEAELTRSARSFANQARLRQSTLKLGPLNQGIDGSIDLVRDGSQKLSSFTA
jgi:hypothetical protein